MCVCPWMSLCTLANDVSVIKASGNRYATDLITNTLVRLAAGGASLTLFIEKSGTGTRVSIGTQPEESAEAPVMLARTSALEKPDGLEWIEARRLVVVESTPGQASTVTLSGNPGAQEGPDNGFEELVAAALSEDFAWVLEVKPDLDSGAQGTRSLLLRAYRVTVPPLLP